MILENETKNKKTIKLRKLAVQDLNTTFSRHLGGRIYRHYMVPVSSSIIGLDPTEEVCKFIELEEGEGTQVVIVSEADRVLNGAQVSSNIIDAMESFLCPQSFKKCLLAKDILTHSINALGNTLGKKRS